MSKQATVKINDAFFGALNYDGRYLVLYGGAGSGKSYFAAQRALLSLLASDVRILVVRKVARTCRFSTWQLLNDIVDEWEIRDLFETNKTEMSLTSRRTGAMLMHLGLDDREKLKSIAGVSVVWIEEATELDSRDFHQLDLRLRGEGGRKQIVLTFNPIDQRHWLRLWMDSKPDGLHVVHTTHVDNKYVGDEYATILSSLPEELRRVYELGLWGTDIRGLIYPDWETTKTFPHAVATKNGKTVEKWVPEKIDDEVYGLDFGYNNPTALVRVGIADNDRTYVDELIYESHLTNADLIERMKALGVRKRQPMFCDHAEPQRIEELRRAGFNAKPANKDVSAGIDSVKRRSLIVTSNSVNLMLELRAYRWDEYRGSEDLKDVPIKLKDHACDALRYAVHSRWGVRKRTAFGAATITH